MSGDVDRSWFATPSVHAPMKKHRLTGARVRGMRIARCGERHRKWEPVLNFANPGAFTECGRCAEPMPIRVVPISQEGIDAAITSFATDEQVWHDTEATQ